MTSERESKTAECSTSPDSQKERLPMELRGDDWGEGHNLSISPPEGGIVQGHIGHTVEERKVEETGLLSVEKENHGSSGQGSEEGDTSPNRSITEKAETDMTSERESKTAECSTSPDSQKERLPMELRGDDWGEGHNLSISPPEGGIVQGHIGHTVEERKVEETGLLSVEKENHGSSGQGSEEGDTSPNRSITEKAETDMTSERESKTAECSTSPDSQKERLPMELRGDDWGEGHNLSISPPEGGIVQGHIGHTVEERKVEETGLLSVEKENHGSSGQGSEEGDTNPNRSITEKAETDMTSERESKTAECSTSPDSQKERLPMELRGDDWGEGHNLSISPPEGGIVQGHIGHTVEERKVEETGLLSVEKENHGSSGQGSEEGDTSPNRSITEKAETDMTSERESKTAECSTSPDSQKERLPMELRGDDWGEGHNLSISPPEGGIVQGHIGHTVEERKVEETGLLSVEKENHGSSGQGSEEGDTSPNRSITEKAETEPTIKITSSADKNRCAKCSMVVLDVFPMIMQDLMAHTGTKAKTLYNAIMKNVHFRRNLNTSELDMIDTLQTDEFTKIDVSLSYKIIVNFFQLFIPPPSRQWGANPIDTEIGIGEDIERIRRERNRFVHKVDANISEAEYDRFFITFIGVGKRLDAHLKKNINNGYAHAVEQCKTCVLDPEVEKTLLDARADVEQLKKMYSFGLEKQENEVHVYVAKSTEAAIAKIDEDLEEGYTKLKIIVLEVDNSEEVVKYINSLKEDLNSDNINFKGAEVGSIILFIDFKNRVVLDDDLFQSNIRTFIRKIFKLCCLKCYLHTQTNAVIASAAEEFEESTINLPEKAGSCLVDKKGHVVLNFDVKNKIFHSPDSLNKTLKEIFRTLVKKENGQNFLGTTDVYAELVKSGNTTTTEKSFTQAQIPVKTNLPASVTLRQQLNIKMSKNENQYIINCIKMGDELVFSDYDNNLLIICNSDGTNIHHIHLSSRPSFLTDVDINTVAVCCSYDKIIVMINISTRSVTSTINTSGSCNGITYNDNKLYVVIDQCKIHVMDLTGKVIRTIPLPSYDSYDITIQRDRFVCISLMEMQCYSLDGKLIWKYKKDKSQDFRRVTTYNENNVYVTDCQTNTVAVVSDDGKHYRVFLTESDGLNTPCGIYFDRKENILLVNNISDGKAFLFDVKKNHK